MKKIFGLLVTGLLFASFGPAEAQFPERPINVVVYLKPGGAGDVFVRRFVKIAAQYTKAEFVVHNRPGAGGLTAMTSVVQGKPDGYTLAYITKSVVAKFADSASKIKLDDLNWLALMVEDPESLIVNKNAPINTLDKVIADAKAKKGDQLWVGPAAGGNDHVMARKVWRALGIRAKWVPFSSGGDAMVALMGQHGVVYVGNPDDVTGKPELVNIVIAAPKRLSSPWSDIPTFKELGIKGLDDEIMWRGFVTKSGIPKAAQDFYTDLITKVSKDSTWRKYIEDGGANAVFRQHDKFKAIAAQDLRDFAEILKELAAGKPN